MTNMDMWDRLEKTDPKYTKTFNRGGFSGTATNGTYIIKRLTEEFGPCGTGWCFVLDDEQIVEGHTLKSGDKAKLHIVRGHLAYKVSDAAPKASSKEEDWSGTWLSTSPQYGQTMLVGENKNGTFTDEEAPKKSITDCISKCAVLLGIAADIHLGLFDDNKYVNERKAEYANPQREAIHGPSTLKEEPRVQHRSEPPVPIDDPDTEKARSAYKVVMQQIRNAGRKAHIDFIRQEYPDEIALVKSSSPAGYQALEAAMAGAAAELPE